MPAGTQVANATCHTRLFRQSIYSNGMVPRYRSLQYLLHLSILLADEVLRASDIIHLVMKTWGLLPKEPRPKI